MFGIIGVMFGIATVIALFFAEGGAYERFVEEQVFGMYGYSYPYGMMDGGELEMLFGVTILAIFLVIIFACYLVGRMIDKRLAKL